MKTKNPYISLLLGRYWAKYKLKGRQYAPLRLFHIFHNGKALRFLVEEGYRSAIFNFMVDFVRLGRGEQMTFSNYQNALHFILDSGVIEISGHGVLDLKGESLTIPPSNDASSRVVVRGSGNNGGSFYVVRFFLIF